MGIEWKRRGMMLGIVVGTLAGYKYLLPAGIPFLTAWILAGWLYPWTAKIEKKTKIKKSIAGGILLFFLTGALLLLLYWCVGEAWFQIREVLADTSGFLKGCSHLLDQGCELLEKTVGISSRDSRNYVMTQIHGMTSQAGSLISARIFGNVFGCVKGIFFLVSVLVVTFISTLLFLGDMEHIRRTAGDYSWLAGIRRIVRRLQKTVFTYLKAQIVLMFLVSVICIFWLWMMGNPYFLLLGGLLGLLDALPLIGTGTFLYPAAILFLVKEQAGAAVSCFLLDFVTSFARESLEPRLLGGKLGVSPVFILASVYLGVLLYGGAGVLLGPLAFSTIFEWGREWNLWD